MPLQLQLRRGTSTQNDAFTGAVGEITIDTTNRIIRVHDNSTVGGSALVNIDAAQTLTNKTLTSPVIVGHATIEGAVLTGKTGTGNLVLSVAPALTGNATAVNLTVSGTLTVGSVNIKSLSVAMAVALS